MIKIIKASKIEGQIKAPPSKSQTQRAIVASLLTKGESLIKNPIFCDDTNTAIKVARNMGAEINISNDKIKIKGGIKIKNNILNCGESGLCARLFSSIASLCKEKILIIGEGTLKSRPFSMIESAFKMLKIDCKTNKGYLPIHIKGPNSGGIINIDASISSQFLSGLLMALPLCENDSIIFVNMLKSKPYIDLTLQFLQEYGISIHNETYKKFSIKGKQRYKTADITIESDWSNSAFHLIAGAIAGKVSLINLNLYSVQGDKNIIQVLKNVGAEVIISESNIVKVNKKELKAFNYDANDTPDLFPPLVALACNCKGTSSIKGVHRLIHKESNRAEVLQKEFSKIGANIYIKNDTMYINSKQITGGIINSHKDHRIAMAGSIIAINSIDDIEIHNAECVSKSYPNFFQDFKLIGGKISE